MQNHISTRSYLKQIFTFILLINFLSGLVPAQSPTKRRAVNPVPKKDVSTEQRTNAAETLTSSGKNSPMSKVWQTGELPAPLAMPVGSTDEVAAILAQKVAARNEQSVPALLTAVQLAGFFITDKKGQTLYTPPDGRGQGLPINGWELASAARMYSDNRNVNLSDLDRQLSSVPILRGFTADKKGVGAILIEGIKTHSDNTRNPYLRVWARFIIELGKNSAARYDLASDKAQVEQINLDAIQHLLIMRRLYGDFWAKAEQFKTIQNAQSEIQPRSEVQFVNASFDNRINAPNRNSDDFRFELLNAKKAVGADDKNKDNRCRMDGDAPTIFDAVATSLGMVWDAGLERAADSSDAEIKKFGSKYAAFLTVANILLVYAKFIQTYAALETTITAEDSAPLIRTKNSVPGARKKLRAEVRLSIGNWQTYNCLRTAMNIMTGLDFSTLNDGPLGGVGVQWGLSQGGAGDFYSNAGGINYDGEQIVGFTTENPKRIQDKGVSAGKGLGNLTFNKTDDKGITEIILEGTPQRNAKLGKLNQIRKQARVTTAIEIKAGEIKGDMVDVFGQWADGLPGLLTMPAELLYRTSWAASGALEVPVIDWEECTGDWSGTITYTWTNKFKESETGKLPSARGEATVTREMDNTYSAQISVNGIEATASVASNSKFTETRDTWEMNACRNNTPMRRMSCTITRKQQTDGSGGGQANIRIVVNRNAGIYGISGGTPGVQGVSSGSESGTCSGQCQPLYVKPTDYSYKGTAEGHRFQVSGQKLSAPNALELIGSETQEIAPNVTVKISWNLRQCGSQANLVMPNGESKLKAETYAGATFLEANKFFEPISIFKPFDIFPSRHSK